MSKSTTSPHLARFLSDFTLGFSDGLTVPFALTAGLSSLGRTDTVIYAGLAELCAGSISMGIGGYLSAQDELPVNDRSSRTGEVEEEELAGMLHDSSDDGSGAEEKDDSRGEEIVRRHLEPLELSGSDISEILSALSARPGGMEKAARSLRSYRRASSVEVPAFEQSMLCAAPIMCGLSISMGYVVGGVIPLFPYFFTANVGTGLHWSIFFCLVALFSYGSGKSWLLRGRTSRSWRKCLWEGLQMMILGALAAAAAVLCVNLVGSKEGGE